MKIWWPGIGLCTASICLAGIIQQETISPGVTYTHYSAPGPNHVFVVAIDCLHSEYRLKVGWAQGKRNYTARERTSVICSRYDNPPGDDVLAGINGSFIDPVNLPRMLGVGQTDGQMLDTPAFNSSYQYHTVMVGPARRPVVRTNFAHQFGTITFADGYSMPLTQYNFYMGGPLVPINGITAFTPHFDSSTRTDFSINPSLAAEVVLTDVSYPMRGDKEIAGIVSAIHSPTSGNTAIPAGGLVLSAWGSTRSELVSHAQIGQRVRVRIATGDPEFNNSDNAITGIGWVIHDGAAYPGGWSNLESGAAPGSRNPRTVLAWNDTHWFMVVCDGRTGISVGMTFQEMADFLIGTLAAKEAVNYDGGGSSTLVVDGTVRNTPSDGSERAIGNAIMLVRRDESSFPMGDIFPAAGRATGWDDKFTYNEVIPFTPASPGGDGYVVRVMNPNGSVETMRRGDFGDTDYVVNADIYCEYRPEDAQDGFERYALFVRDSGTGALGLADYGGGNCYALTYDSHDGRVRAGKYVDGQLTDFLETTPVHLPSTAWRRFSIGCAGATIRYFVDDELLLQTNDESFAHGYFGIGYHQFFATAGLAHGTRADNVQAVEMDGPPGKATSPVPAHLTTAVPLNATLDWTPGIDSESFDVYFGTESPGTFRGNQVMTGFSPGSLALGTTYYWRIDSINVNGTTIGDVWSFTTRRYRGDFDDDGDVDQEDFGEFQVCLTGTGIPQMDPACDGARLDPIESPDLDVDEDDLAVFLGCMAGPGISPPESCVY